MRLQSLTVREVPSRHPFGSSHIEDARIFGYIKVGPCGASYPKSDCDVKFTALGREIGACLISSGPESHEHCNISLVETKFEK